MQFLSYRSQKSFSKYLLCSFVCLASAAIASAGDLLVSSQNTNSIKRYNGATGAYMGDFVAPGVGGLQQPQGITYGPDGNLYVSSAGAQNQVLRYDGQTGAFMGVFTSGVSMAFTADMSWHNGKLYVSDFSTNGRVIEFNGTTGAFNQAFTQGTPYKGSDGISWDPAGNMYVSSFGTNTVRKYNSTGIHQGDFVTAGLGGLLNPLDNRFDAAGNFYVTSFNDGTVKKYSSTGAFLGNFATGLGQTQGQEIGPDGALYAGSWGGSFINRYDATTGAFLNTFVSVGSGGLAQPNNFVFMPVPEPGTIIVLGGLAALAIRKRRKG